MTSAFSGLFSNFLLLTCLFVYFVHFRFDFFFWYFQKGTAKTSAGKLYVEMLKKPARKMRAGKSEINHWICPQSVIQSHARYFMLCFWMFDWNIPGSLPVVLVYYFVESFRCSKLFRNTVNKTSNIDFSLVHETLTFLT